MLNLIHKIGGICILSFLVVTLSGSSSVKKVDEYPIVGAFQNEPAQGMAIFKDKAFLFNNTGICRVYDLKKQQLINHFLIGSNGPNNHANCASFGIEYLKNNKKFPAIYISECRKPYRCFVESINLQGSKLIQTLQFKRNGNEEIVHDWIVDTDLKKIYAIARKTPVGNEAGDYINTITSFRLPAINEGDIVFSEKDIEDDFQVIFPNLLQGATIRNQILYLPTGIHENAQKRKDAQRAIIVVDLKKKSITNTIDLENITKNEPEDVDFYKGKLLLYCGQTGGIFQIDF